MIKVANIGIGRWGRILLSSFAKKCEIECYSSRGNLSNIEKINDNIDFRTIDEILKDTSISAVIIAVSIENLYHVAKKSLAANKHVFLEKPGSLTEHEFKDLYNDLAEEQVLYIDYLTLLDPVYCFLKNKLKNQQIKSINFLWEKSGSFNPDILLNLASHDIGILHDLCDGEIFVNKAEISKERCHIAFSLKDIKSEIMIDRSKVNQKKIICVETSCNDIYIWDKVNGMLFLNDAVIYEKKSIDLVSISRDRFLDLINLKKPDLVNINLSCKILNTIEKIRK